ncbi:hypothetical protein [Agathobaculum sp.]|uniref:hypothetical protein n=1 Tax=Agathobaculum sp. TaxID=2048138 RepID=UPI003521AABD
MAIMTGFSAFFVCLSFRQRPAHRLRRRLREVGSQAVIRAESGIGYYLQPA